MDLTHEGCKSGITAGPIRLCTNSTVAEKVGLPRYGQTPDSTSSGCKGSTYLLTFPVCSVCAYNTRIAEAGQEAADEFIAKLQS